MTVPANSRPRVKGGRTKLRLFWCLPLDWGVLVYGVSFLGCGWDVGLEMHMHIARLVSFHEEVLALAD